VTSAEHTIADLEAVTDLSFRVSEK
jgi:hypothetical protein